MFRLVSQPRRSFALVVSRTPPSAVQGSVGFRSKSTLSSTLFSPKPKTGKSTPIPSPATSSTASQSVLECWTDAATLTSRIAVVVGNQYKVFKLKDGWDTDGRNINWAETVGLELMFPVLAALRYSGQVLLRSDSNAALSIFCGTKSRSPELEACRMRLHQAQTSASPTLEIDSAWVKGEENLADPFSRGKILEGYSRLDYKVKVPRVLRPFVISE